jgi:hypothetical protein
LGLRYSSISRYIPLHDFKGFDVAGKGFGFFSEKCCPVIIPHYPHFSEKNQVLLYVFAIVCERAVADGHGGGGEGPLAVS